MAAVKICRIVIFILAVFSVGEAFRLRARFPRPQSKDFRHHAKRYVCRYCNYDTKTFRQKVRLNIYIYLQNYTAKVTNCPNSYLCFFVVLQLK